LSQRTVTRFVSAWTNEHLHLGNTATSPAEGIHGTIKADIETKNIDLLYVWDVIHRVVERQLKGIDGRQRDQRINTLAHYQGKIFDVVRGYVSFAALEHAYDQMILAKKSLNLSVLSSINSTYTSRI
jgi:hypothetical protein